MTEETTGSNDTADEQPTPEADGAEDEFEIPTPGGLRGLA